MKDSSLSDTTLYKYRKFDAQTLSLLINKELYFSSPENLNDPYDCQISISKSIQEAISIAKKRHPQSLTREKVNLLVKLARESEKIETEIKSAGILSFSRDSSNVLMWTHYSDEHRGLCVGFRLPDEMLTVSDDADGKIIGANRCAYFSNNPFVNFLANIGVTEPLLPWDDFWFRVFGIGLAAKHNSWRYEKEVRIVMTAPGTQSFKSDEIVEIIFGLNMNFEHTKTVLKLLSGDEWAHVKFSKMTKYKESFRLNKIPLSDSEMNSNLHQIRNTCLVGI